MWFSFHIIVPNLYIIKRSQKTDLADLEGPLFTSADIDYTATELVAFPGEEVKELIVDENLEYFAEPETQFFFKVFSNNKNLIKISCKSYALPFPLSYICI